MASAQFLSIIHSYFILKFRVQYHRKNRKIHIFRFFLQYHQDCLGEIDRITINSWRILQVNHQTLIEAEVPTAPPCRYKHQLCQYQAHYHPPPLLPQLEFRNNFQILLEFSDSEIPGFKQDLNHIYGQVEDLGFALVWCPFACVVVQME